jgi:hypothetical protein
MEGRLTEQQRKPSPNFYRFIAVVFLIIGGILISQAVRRHEWFFWAIAILTVVNGVMAAIKSLIPGETKK